MIRLASVELCNGCSACVNACMRDCILLVPNALGFLYPQIAMEDCVECHACEKVCPILTPCLAEKTPIQVYTVKNRNTEERLESSSGGFFVLLARKILADGGVVFGVRWLSGWRGVGHSFTEDVNELSFFMGSKYLPSHIGDSYRHVRMFLKAGRLVLFTGTPCQITGLNAFLKQSYPNLVTMEVICMGVPSPAIFYHHLQELAEEKVIGAPDEIISISFRNKSAPGGWRNYTIEIVCKRKSSNDISWSYQVPHWDDSFFKLFLSCLILRKSCHSCLVKSYGSVADFTVGDAWRIHEILPEFDDNLGASWICIRTSPGLKWFDKLKDDLVFHPVNYECVWERNPSIIQSAARNPKQHLFNQHLGVSSIATLAKSFTTPSSWNRLQRKLKNILNSSCKLFPEVHK